MQLIFEADSEQNKFNHIFDIVTGFLVTKQYDKIIEIFNYCLNNLEKSKADPSVLMHLLLLTRGVKQVASHQRIALYNLMESVYSETYKGKEKQLAVILLGLK